MQKDDLIEPSPAYGQQQPSPQPSLTSTKDVLQYILGNHLLPNFNMPRANVSSRIRMEYAYKEWVSRKEGFLMLHRAKPAWRHLLEHPHTRLVLYRLWLARPTLSLWEFNKVDPSTHTPLEEIRKNVSFPSDEPWRMPKGYARGRILMPNARQVRDFDYKLALQWYDTFMDDAYANHYLEFVARTACRLNLLPVGTVHSLLHSWGIPDDQIAQTVRQPPSTEAVTVNLAVNHGYYTLMEALTSHPPDANTTQLIELADRTGLLAPGVAEMLDFGQWHLYLGDDRFAIRFPGSSILVQEDWDSDTMQPLMWLYDILTSISIALANTTIIRVPSFAVREMFYHCRTSVLLDPPPIEFSESADTRASTSILVQDTPDQGIPRRRWVFFNPPIDTLPVAYLTEIQKGVQQLQNHYKSNAVLHNQLAFLQHILRDAAFHSGIVTCRHEKGLILKNVRLMSLKNTNRAVSRLYHSAKPAPSPPNVVYPSLYVVFISVTTAAKPLATMEKRLLPRQRPIRDLTKPLENEYTAHMELMRPSHLTLHVNLIPEDTSPQHFQARMRHTIAWTTLSRSGAPHAKDEKDVVEWIRVVGSRRTRGGRTVAWLEAFLPPDPFQEAQLPGEGVDEEGGDDGDMFD